MVDFKKLLEEQKLQSIINALCERANRCTVCYGDEHEGDCVTCKEYYSECQCTPLTPEQIINGVED